MSYNDLLAQSPLVNNKETANGTLLAIKEDFKTSNKNLTQNLVKENDVLEGTFSNLRITVGGNLIFCNQSLLSGFPQST